MLFKPAAIKSTIIYLLFSLGFTFILLDASAGAFAELAAWLFSINIILFAVMGKDKFSSILKFGRTPEGTLLWLSFAGAFPALFLARLIFNHKTTKAEFKRPMWFLLIIQVCILLYYFVMIENF